MIETSHGENLIRYFESMGFEMQHIRQLDAVDGRSVSDVSMKDENGFRVDICRDEAAAADRICIRLNVDDFDEAYKTLTAQGFRDIQEGRFMESRTAVETMLVAPSGLGIRLVRHKK